MSLMDTKKLPPKLYPEEPDCDRLYRRDIVPIFKKAAKVTKIYFELRR